MIGPGSVCTTGFLPGTQGVLRSPSPRSRVRWVGGEVQAGLSPTPNLGRRWMVQNKFIAYTCLQQINKYSGEKCENPMNTIASGGAKWHSKEKRMCADTNRSHLQPDTLGAAPNRLTAY